MPVAPMKLAFVTPRYGRGVLGGAEAVMAQVASGLAERGHDVQILTTCALDHYTWENVLDEGTEQVDGLVVHRFPVVRHPSRAALKAQLDIQAGTLPDLDHQVSWLGFQFSLPGLFAYLARYGDGYQGIVFSPYLFWTTSVCMPLLAHRAVVIPCLHDELYARLDILRPVFENPALMWFMSEPEHELAHRLGPLCERHEVTGEGVPVPEQYDPESFRRKHKLSKPFLLFAGRREEGKGLGWLLSAFSQAVQGHGADMDLVILGKGDLSRYLADLPDAVRARVTDVGFVDDAERDNAFAAATAYVQPSVLESFSRTIMEAWLAGTPVLANADSEVVSWHCQRSGGGLTFANGTQLAAQWERLGQEEGLAASLAAAGRQYVLGNYGWGAVLDRMEASLAAAL